IVLKRDIYPAADAVEVVTDDTHWWDVAGYSGRLGREQRLGGLVGTALYRTDVWAALLPWLVWGEVVQVGKNVVKGCGVYRLQGGQQWQSSNI
ncbi:MAG: CRISPR system precrRNA processing endoribonuclease RAMP protein Cas6, partial [Caldilinea sp.]